MPNALCGNARRRERPKRKPAQRQSGPTSGKDAKTTPTCTKLLVIIHEHPCSLSSTSGMSTACHQKRRSPAQHAGTVRHAAPRVLGDSERDPASAYAPMHPSHPRPHTANRRSARTLQPLLPCCDRLCGHPWPVPATVVTPAGPCLLRAYRRLSRGYGRCSRAYGRFVRASRRWASRSRRGCPTRRCPRRSRTWRRGEVS